MRSVPTAVLLNPKDKADYEYEAALENWHTQIQEQTERELERLTPRRLRQIGMPTEMPAESLRIVAHVRTLDVLARSKPSRESFYRKYGV